MTPGHRGLRGALALGWARWKAIAYVIGNFQARVLLWVFYFAVMPPFALIVKLFKDPLGLRAPRVHSSWIERPAPDVPSQAGRRQY